jgi:Fe-S cluster biosynthesis and repair protein YggX
MNICIKFPSRERPEKFKTTFDSYCKLSSGKHNIHFICSFDEDDLSMNNQDIRSYLDNSSKTVNYFFGKSTNKIEAINANLEILNENNTDILILAADDLYPCQHNYDEIIVNDMLKYHPNMDGCLHYMNPSWEERLDIGCIMTIKYFTRFNYIYHPSYKTIFCDNEYMEVAKILDKHIYIPKQVFIHNYVVSDPTANRNWIFNQQDENNYNLRKANHFYM